MSSESFNPFACGEIERVAPSTFAQREVIASSQMSDEASTAFNEGVTIHIRGAVDVELFERSFQVLVDRHESFRLAFSRKGDEICLQESARGRFKSLDIRNRSDQEQREYLENLYYEIAASPMNLEDGPLLFCWLIQLTNDSSQLVFAAHHVICDGWSYGLLLTELATIYSDDGRDLSLEEAPSFLDFAEQYHANQVLNKDVDYWKAKFKTVPPNLDLPLDFPRPAERPFKGARYDYIIDGEFAQQLRSASSSMKSSLINVVLSAYSVLLYRLTGNEDIVIGLPVAGQAALNELTLVGHLVHLLPIRVELDESTKFSELMVQVKSAVFDASDHPQFTFGELVKELSLDRSRVPLISTICNVDQKMPTLEFGEALGDVNSIARSAENFELFLNIFPKDDELVIEATYSTVLFKEVSIVSWLDGLKSILASVIENPELSVGEISLASEVPEFDARVNQTAYQCKNASMIEAIERSVHNHAQREALVCSGRRLSYQAMWERVSTHAAYLASEGVEEGQVIGICCERSENLVIATLALHRLGAAYLPLDPTFPVDRLSFVCQDAGSMAAIVDAKGRELLGGTERKLLDVTGASSAEALKTVANDPDRLAYIIYTSGSSGKPKGVEISWGSMINLLESMLVEPGFEASNTLLAVTTLAFDISIVELFLPLMVGGRVVIAEQDDLKDGGAIGSLIDKHKVDYLQSTPATFQLLMSSSWAESANQTLVALCCGEPLPPALADALIPRVNALWNMYGPTEATVYATRKLLSRPGEQITIGRTIENTRTYILDTNLNPVPMSVPGELCIAGDNLAIAYHGRPDLTEAAFVEHPTLGRLYRTGDLAKWNTNKEIVLLGRMDDQVKIRGYRIELGEIEKAIVNTGLVDTVAVILIDESETDRKLVACCKSAQAGDSIEAQIKTEIRKVLPGYMVPHHFTFLEIIPLTNSSKVDRKALRAMPLDLSVRVDMEGGEPSGESEVYLAELWQDIIDIDSVYVEDNFFDIGGHSLLAAQLIAQLAKDRGVQLPFNALISSTLGQISENYLDCDAGETTNNTVIKIKKGWLSSFFRKN